MNTLPDNFVRRPDGSFIDLTTLEPRKQLRHELVTKLFPMAEAEEARLISLKRLALTEMHAYRDMMMEEYGIKVTGSLGGFSLRSECGTMLVKLDITSHITFTEELQSAKALIDRFLEEELKKGGSPYVAAIVEKVFRINSKGRLDTYGILGLQSHKFDDSLWKQAMKAIDDAICRDSSTSYIRFYRVDPDRKVETIVALDMAKV